MLGWGVRRWHLDLWQAMWACGRQRGRERESVGVGVRQHYTPPARLGHILSHKWTVDPSCQIVDATSAYLLCSHLPPALSWLVPHVTHSCPLYTTTGYATQLRSLDLTNYFLTALRSVHIRSYNILITVLKTNQRCNYKHLYSYVIRDCQVQGLKSPCPHRTWKHSDSVKRT